MIGNISGVIQVTQSHRFTFIYGRSWNFLFENIKRNVFLTRVASNW